MRMVKMIGLAAVAALAAMAFVGAASTSAIDRSRRWSSDSVAGLKLVTLQAVRRTVCVSKVLAFQLALKARNLALKPTNMPIENSIRFQAPVYRRIGQITTKCDSDLDSDIEPEFAQLTRKSNDYLWNTNGYERRLILSPA